MHMEAEDHSINIDAAKLGSSSLKQKLDSLPPVSGERCIFRVPNRWRRVSQNALTPRVISIGPLHHGKKSLRAMEEQKLRYVHNFIGTNDPMKLTGLVLKEEPKVRSFYVEPTDKFSSDEFVEMIFIDAAFIIELFMEYTHLKGRNDNHELGTPNMFQDIKHDLCLIENQLPFFVLEDLFNHRYGGSTTLGIRSMLDLTLRFFRHTFSFLDWEHLDLPKLRFVHVLDLIRLCLGPKKTPYGPTKPQSIPSASQVYEAGVELKLATSGNLFDVQFHERGVLEIPPFRLNPSMEVLCANLLVFEQCYCDDYPIAELVSFMRCLVSSAKDADLLVREGIIQSPVRDNERLFVMVKDLAREIVGNANFSFADVVNDLNSYIKRPSQRLKAILVSPLKQNYFTNFYAGLSVITAVVLLVLTIIQTVCALVK